MAIFATVNEHNRLMTFKKTIVLAGILLLAVFPQPGGTAGASNLTSWQEQLPREVLTGEQGKFHAQGIAYDRRNECI